MTPEEAGDEILRGPYSDCVRCKGTGVYVAPVYDFTQDPCRSCGGSGKWVRGDYKQACVELGMDMPPPPPSKSPASTWASGKILDIHVFDRLLGAEDIAKRFREQSEKLSKFRTELLGEWDSVDERDGPDRRPDPDNDDDRGGRGASPRERAMGMLRSLQGKGVHPQVPVDVLRRKRTRLL